ncbi:hypothetical protein BSN85_26680 [Bradyrhizobium brasilense]|nr:hypothetical protein BSN85_26680 [Bradyrhizobium brasilense]
MITQSAWSHARVIAVDIAIRLIFGCSRARHSCMQIEPTGDDTTRPCEMIALSNPDRAIAPPQPCDTMPRHSRSAAVRTGLSPILAIPWRAPRRRAAPASCAARCRW